MSSLIPVPKKDISAIYHGLGRYLEVIAQGSLTREITLPFIKQEPYVGGLFFSIRGYSVFGPPG
ncbi:hypothetical protein B0T26DRAFT_725873 [Lasiosphaeria miniovina]|uniref:Uncharacterized protein n=1 Tax=Lasiosphaeria miniovina TaxID=1954250 RepID=A0AA40DJT8_9PEZI|nr:uncharacterized protein B0T26DRAFT_725873 [Lasiosphaeria miniovina]KAK0706234.1 hypothetical protein B0T26DRAFT_725873 [Lasiosphaeria miniovina]